jgi:hypothetical protein
LREGGQLDSLWFGAHGRTKESEKEEVKKRKKLEKIASNFF